MRISTANLYATSTNQLNTLQGALARTQMQLSTDRRLLTAADDPVASARALEVGQSQEPQQRQFVAVAGRVDVAEYRRPAAGYADAGRFGR
jgi:flagellin-like hook-associated protein FlgL